MNSNKKAFDNYQQEQLKRLESGFVMCRDLLDVTEYNEETDMEGFFVIPSSGSNVIGRYRILKDMENSIPNIIVRKTVYNMLCEADKSLKRKKDYENCQIVVTYGYRSLDVQKNLFNEHYERKKVLNPEMSEEKLIEATHIEIAYPEVAGHPTGGAVDITIYDMKKKEFLDFGTEICEFETKNVYYAADSINAIAKKNRKVLRKIMCEQGFAPYDGEWWHFSYGDKEWAFYMSRRASRLNNINSKPIALYKQKNISEISEIAYNDKYKTHINISQNETIIKLAIQKDGRLTDETLSLLQKSGIKISVNKSGYLAKSNNFPIEIILVRDDDIPNLVDSGVADIGIVGENVYIEKNCNSIIKKYLGFGKCFLALAIPKNSNIENIYDLSGKRIATSYRNITSNFLNEKGINATIIDISGSVEVAPVINYADAIIDLVSTGSSLKQNNLEVLYNILNSQSILIANTSSNCNEKKKNIIDQLIRRIDCYLFANKYKQLSMVIARDMLDKTIDAIYSLDNFAIENNEQLIDPLKKYGIGVPYIHEIYGCSEYIGLFTIIENDKIWKIIEKLKDFGASNIVFSDIEGIIQS